MGWKNWSYWVRGGVIAIVPGILLAFVLTFFVYVVISSLAFGPQAINICSAYSMFGDTSEPAPELCTNYLRYSVLIGMVAYFISLIILLVIGAIIGLIYGKIKKREKIDTTI